ncbi:MAG TPA: 16S rRNA (cytosine(1402)-N(4))-methyltransferase RsmH [Gemmatimonadaceae bacterium]|nr:16S rRNA (cytosine(1402)-N(4))-methyltransferase RsmH [Gemmatimonadaceae bacterium]
MMMRAFDTAYHAPVLADEVVRLLGSAKSVLDGTLGGGGHSAALLTAGVQSLVGLDRDPQALEVARARLEPLAADRVETVHANYADAPDNDALRGRSFDGILLDLGISSRQIDATERGFSFREGAPLDMRMESSGVSAADVLNESDEEDLARIFRDYGGEPKARRLAREVVRRRAREPFSTSDDLVRAIRGALGPRSGPGEFARLFQAVRIAVNDEIDGLRRALPALRGMLSPGGVFVIITYHSGEDRLVKHTFREWSTACVCPPKQPQCTCGGVAAGTTLTRKAVVPSAEETARNPRARSAKLRAWKKGVE